MLRAVPLILAACAGGPAAAVECRIETAEAGRSVEIRALAIAARPAALRWRLRVERSSLAGLSLSSQSGEAVLAAGEERLLGRVVVGAGGRLEGTLTLEGEGGTTRCDLP